MAMTEAEQQRFSALKRLDGMVSFWEAESIYGFRPNSEFLRPHLIAFQNMGRSEKPIIVDDRVSRYLLEYFLDFSRLMPARLGAARVGMTEESLRRVLATLVREGRLMLTDPFVNEGLADARIIESLHKYFRTLGDRVFGDYNDYCRRLHEAIRTELRESVEPLYCETSRGVRPADPEYAYTLCMISLEPTGVANQVYLNFGGKWLRLSPDVCSRRFYKLHEQELQPFVFGAPPQLEDLP